MLLEHISFFFDAKMVSKQDNYVKKLTQTL